MTISRRAVLVAGVGVAGAIVGARAWRKLSRSSAHDIEALLRKRLGYLTFDATALALFSEEYVKRYGAQAMRVHYEQTFGGIVEWFPFRRLLPADRAHDVRTFERRLVSLFLRSTDCFSKSRTAGQPIAYLAFADPYQLPCANPFAVL